MIRIITILAALAMTTTVQAAPDEKTRQCSQAVKIAMATFQAKKSGMTEQQAMNELRKHKIYSGPIVWAVKQAMDTPNDTADWILHGSLFGECMKRGWPR